MGILDSIFNSILDNDNDSEEEYDWYCDECGAYLNDQDGFTSSYGSWTCTECGSENDVSEDNIIPDEGSNGYVSERTYDDGTTEKVRFTKNQRST